MHFQPRGGDKDATLSYNGPFAGRESQRYDRERRLLQANGRAEHDPGVGSKTTRNLHRSDAGARGGMLQQKVLDKS